jgi:hypothetical protein
VTEEAPDLEQHAPREYVCERCGKQFANRSGLWKHKPKCAVEPADAPEQPKDTPRTPAERKPKLAPAPRGKRHDCSHLLSPLWTQLARIVPSVPAQRAMVWQAPGAGRALDDALSGTVVDKWVLQKVSGAESKYRPAIDLVSLPVMLMMVERQPASFPVIAPMLRSAVRANLEAALDAKATEKAQDDKLKAKAEAAGLVWETIEKDQDGQDVKVDLVDRILSGWFEGMTVPEGEKQDAA